jgi:hypothetical protein
MLGTYYATPRPLPWARALPQRRARRTTPQASAAQAVRHGLRGAIQATCLSAAVLAAAGAVGASRGPVVLSDPSQATAQHSVVMAMPSSGLADWRMTR